MDEPVFIGRLVETRLLGVIEAEQTEAGKIERNDRLIAVAAESHTDVRGKKSKPTARKGPAVAKRLIRN